MTFRDALNIAVTVTGVAAAQSQLRQLRQSMEEFSDQGGTVGAVVAGASLAIGTMAVRAHEELERMRRSFVNVLGLEVGNTLAAQMVEFQRTSQIADETLTGFATTFVNLSGSAEGLLEVMRALDKFAPSMSVDQMTRAGIALAQIAGMPNVQAPELRQLVQAGFPLDAVAKSQGLNAGMDLVGLDTGKFFVALDKAAAGAVRFENTLSTDVTNAFDQLRRSFAPTGEALSRMLRPVARGVQLFFELFERVNKATGGIAGLFIVVGTLVVGVGMMVRAAWQVVAALKALAAAASGAAARGAGGAGAAGGGGGAVPAPVIVPPAQRMPRAPAPALPGGNAPALPGPAPAVATGAAWAAAINSAVYAMMGTGLAVVVAGFVLEAVIVGIAEAVSGKKVKGPRMGDWFWNGLKIAPSDPKPERKQAAAEQPQRRTDLEQVWERGLGWGLR